MKKLLSIILSTLLLVTAFAFSGCTSIITPTYSIDFEYNETHHWRPLIGGNGDEYIDYGKHVNKKGKCDCGFYYKCPYLTYMLNSAGTGLICFGAANPEGYDRESIRDYDGNYNVSDPDNNWLHVEVPAEAEYNGVTYPVVEIGEYAFRCDQILSIKLNEGLIRVGNEAFAYASGLTEIVIPNSVIEVGTSICYWAPGLEKFVFGDMSSSVPNYGFYNCSNLKTVKLGKNIRWIGVLAFYRCTSVEYMVIPSSLTEIRATSSGLPTSSFHGPFGGFNSNGRLYFEHQSLPAGVHPEWNPDGILYYLAGQWEYDSNGVPRPKR